MMMESAIIISNFQTKLRALLSLQPLLFSLYFFKLAQDILRLLSLASVQKRVPPGFFIC